MYFSFISEVVNNIVLITTKLWDGILSIQPVNDILFDVSDTAININQSFAIAKVAQLGYTSLKQIYLHYNSLTLGNKK